MLQGCASLPQDLGYRQAQDLVQARRDQPGSFNLDAGSDAAITAPPLSGEVGLDRAVRHALAWNPRVRVALAEIGIARSELDEARRPPNPEFGFARQESDDAGTRIVRSFGWDLSDALFTGTRRRLAQGGLEQAQLDAADSLLDLAAETEEAWFAAVSARQVAAMRALVARAASASATLAERFHDAGNITLLQLEHERAAAVRAEMDAAEADVRALSTKLALGRLMGSPTTDDWQLPESLPLPATRSLDLDELVADAFEQRLDLAAARLSVAQHEDALGVTRRWRWLGSVHFDYERESETDGATVKGPGISLQLPIFNQGQPEVARAEAALARARGQLDATLAAVIHEARAGVADMQARVQMIDRYRHALIPGSARIVEQMQRRFDFMLVGAFDLIATRQAQYDTYQAYLETVRDYWMARSSLRRAVGGRLPDDEAESDQSASIAEMLPDESAGEGMDHSAHHVGHHGGNHGGSHDGQGAEPGAVEGGAQDEDPGEEQPGSHEHHDHGQGEQP